jgi:glycosyltransferase involved in cell wall biosynthesis
LNQIGIGNFLSQLKSMLLQLNALIQKFALSRKSKKYDLAFILDHGNRNWILGAICNEIAAYYSGEYVFSYDSYFPRGDLALYSPKKLKLPPAKAYFFAHYSYFAVCLRKYPNLEQQRTFIFYTHPKGLMSDEAFATAMNRATKVICMCSQSAQRLIDCGVHPERVTYVLGAADPDLFRPHSRTGQGAVGFCTAYYERKDPDRILEIVQRLPYRQFILLGRKWNQYERFAELEAMPNFKYIEASYAEYPQYYAQMDVFVSPAKLEGGPIPLIEAMMCNVVPVASKTGFAPDLIKSGENGFLFDVDSPASEICVLIEQAFQVATDVRKIVEHLSWKNLSIEVQEVINQSI